MVKTGRCDWCGDDPLYVSYHDREWGVPLRDDGGLFELLMLEGMQAGLSWYTVLVRREHMRAAFHGFEPAALASLGPAAVDEWMQDPGLIRHRRKLEALISNARACLALPRSLSDVVWEFVEGSPLQNARRFVSDIPASNNLSNAMSKSLKKAGFSFVGPTICYAFMQAAGLVNDHLVTCPRYEACRDLAPAGCG